MKIMGHIIVTLPDLTHRPVFPWRESCDRSWQHLLIINGKTRVKLEQRGRLEQKVISQCALSKTATPHRYALFKL